MMIVGTLLGIATLGGLGLATWKAPRLTSVTILSLLTTIFVTSAILIHGPGPFDERAVWMTMFIPILWIILQLWCYWDGKPWRVVGGQIGMIVVSAIIVALSGPIE